MKNGHALHVYTGEGKGKTSAAVGAAVRFAGHGGRVLFAQFLKNGRSGEREALTKLGVLLPEMPELSGFYTQMEEPTKQASAAAFQKGATALIRIIEQERPGLIVLDELCVALAFAILPEDLARALIDAALSAGETIVTGRGAPEWLTAQADYWTTLSADRHPYATGIGSREGIEW